MSKSYSFKIGLNLYHRPFLLFVPRTFILDIFQFKFKIKRHTEEEHFIWFIRLPDLLRRDHRCYIYRCFCSELKIFILSSTQTPNIYGP